MRIDPDALISITKSNSFTEYFEPDSMVAGRFVGEYATFSYKGDTWELKGGEIDIHGFGVGLEW